MWGMRRTSSHVIKLLALLAALAYQSWLTAPLLNPELPTATSFASELASTSQAAHWFFRSADVVVGVLVLLVATLLARSSSPVLRGLPRWVRRFLFLAATLFAVATILDAAFPMPCADSLTAPEVVASAHCQTFSLRMHEVASVAVGCATVGAGFVSLAWFLRLLPAPLIGEDGAGFGPERLAFPMWLGILVCVFAAVHILATAATVSADLLGWPSGLGWYQRLSILAAGLWWLALVAGLTAKRAPHV